MTSLLNDSTRPSAPLHEIPAILFADILGTSSRTGPGTVDSHVVQHSAVTHLLDATHLVLGADRFTRSRAALFSDCIFVVAPNPVEAIEIACGIYYYCLGGGTLLRGAIEVGTAWLPTTSPGIPIADNVEAFAAMGRGVTGAARTEALLKGHLGHRLAVGEQVRHWLDEVNSGGSREAKAQAARVRDHLAPTDWRPENQVLWMRQDTCQDIFGQFKVPIPFVRLDEHARNIRSSAPHTTPKGKQAWDETLKLLDDYMGLP